MVVNREIFVGFEVFTAVVVKSIIFWDMTPCGPLSFNRRFGGTYQGLATCLLAESISSISFLVSSSCSGQHDMFLQTKSG
jgi:hypothetical protein